MLGPGGLIEQSCRWESSRPTDEHMCTQRVSPCGTFHCTRRSERPPVTLLAELNAKLQPSFRDVLGGPSVLSQTPSTRPEQICQISFFLLEHISDKDYIAAIFWHRLKARERPWLAQAGRPSYNALSLHEQAPIEGHQAVVDPSPGR